MCAKTIVGKILDKILEVFEFERAFLPLSCIVSHRSYSSLLHASIHFQLYYNYLYIHLFLRQCYVVQVFYGCCSYSLTTAYVYGYFGVRIIIIIRIRTIIL